MINTKCRYLHFVVDIFEVISSPSLNSFKTFNFSLFIRIEVYHDVGEKTT